MFQSVTIKQATAADLPAIETLMFECMTHYFGTAEGALEGARCMVTDDRGSAETIVAFLDDHPAAFATYAVVYPGPEGRGTLYMKDLFVSEAARSRNLGLSLIQYLAGIATSRNCVRFDWTAETSNPRALAFYDRIGAKRVEEKVYFRLEGEQLQAISHAEEGGR